MKIFSKMVASLCAGVLLLTNSIFMGVSAENTPVNPDIDGNGAINSIDATYVLVYAAEYGAGIVSNFSQFMKNHFNVDTAPKIDDSWKAGYINTVNEIVAESGETFLNGALIYLTDDDIPELYCMGGGKNLSGGMYTYKDGEVIKLFSRISSMDYYIGHSPKGGIVGIDANKGYYGYRYFWLCDDMFITDETLWFNEDENAYSINGISVSKQQFNSKMSERTAQFVKAEISYNASDLIELIQSGKVSPTSEFVPFWTN